MIYYVVIEPHGPKWLRLRRVALVPLGMPRYASRNLPGWWAFGDRAAARLGQKLLHRLDVLRQRRTPPPPPEPPIRHRRSGGRGWGI